MIIRIHDQLLFIGGAVDVPDEDEVDAVWALRSPDSLLDISLDPLESDDLSEFWTDASLSDVESFSSEDEIDFESSSDGNWLP